MTHIRDRGWCPNCGGSRLLNERDEDLVCSSCEFVVRTRAGKEYGQPTSVSTPETVKAKEAAKENPAAQIEAPKPSVTKDFVHSWAAMVRDRIAKGEA